MTSQENAPDLQIRGDAFHNANEPNCTEIRLLATQAKAETGSLQAQRLVDFLLEHPDAPTGRIAHECSIGNISLAANYVRPALQKRGLTIACRLPRSRILNHFDEPSQSHLWRIQRLK